MQTYYKIILLLLCGVTSPLLSAANLKFITIDVAPWASIDQQSGQAVGAFPEIIKLMEKHTKHEIEMTFTPFARVDRELELGRQDCTILVTGEERARIAEQGALVSYHPIGIIARKDVPLKTYEDLSRLTISVLRGAPMSPRFDNDDSLNKEFDTDYAIGLRKMARGRLDAIAGAIPTIFYLAQQEGLKEHLGDRLLLANVPLLLQCSKKSQYLKQMPVLNKAIEIMQKDGSLDAIKEKYHF